MKKNLIEYDYGRKVKCPEEANQKLFELIARGDPFVAGRYGSTEMNSIMQVLKNKMGFGRIREIEVQALKVNAGFFSNDLSNFVKHAELNLSLCEEVNMLGLLGTRFEDYLVREHMKNALISPLYFLEPYYFAEPWSRSLEGKKVLVVHPFSETIESQYKRREFLFRNQQILPNFQLITLKAVQSIAGNKPDFETWFDALESMFNDAMKMTFDIAIIGCGAYGLPLAIKLKKEGKQAIHMGGATQILFGIRGLRWENHPTISKLFNEYWVRPALNEVPQGSSKIEEGCYW